MCAILSNDNCQIESDFSSFSLLMAHLYIELLYSYTMCMNYITIGGQHQIQYTQYTIKYNHEVVT